MAGMRSVQNLNISLGMFGFPVKVYKATEDASSVGFTQIHDKCGSSINQVKRCHKCEQDVTMADLLKGVKNADGTYTTFTEAEIKALKPERDGVVKIDGYAAMDSIDSCYQDGTIYYLSPGDKDTATFTTWRDALAGRWAIGRVVMYGRERVVAIRATDRLLSMHYVRTHDEIRDIQNVPGYENVPEVSNREYADLMGQLIDRAAIGFEDVVLESDSYATAVKELVAARQAGQPNPTPKETQAPAKAVDLMAMLKASLAAK